MTGGASCIGHAIVRRLAAEGAQVVIADIAETAETVALVQCEGGSSARTACGQVGPQFGSGIHGCVGQLGAKLEGEALLGVLARRVRRIYQDGPAELHVNNTLRG